MKFQKILILHKENLPATTLDKIEEVKKYFSEKIIRILNYQDVTKQNINDMDLIISFGGDGTFVKAANLIETTPILGINANPETSEGVLTSLSIEELPTLARLQTGDFILEKKHRVQVRLNGKLLDEHAINEVYVGAQFHHHSARYKIKFQSQEEEHRSSGVIISTGAGSPAWYQSAGGTPFLHSEKKLAFIVREPYTGKNVYMPRILRGFIQAGEKIIFESMHSHSGIVAIHDTIYGFNKGDVAEIELSDKPLNVIVFPKQSA